MRIKTNLGGIVRSTNNRKSKTFNQKPLIGKVYGVVLNENTPSKELFEKAGGWSGIGSAYYIEYTTAKNNTGSIDLNQCKIAKPLYSNLSYPLIGELIHLVSAPSPVSQVNNTSNQKYYTGTVNIWNNPQQNSPDSDNFGKTFSENADIRNLQLFEGDTIFQGRKGNGIRFGSTVKLYSDVNEWSSIGNDGDPITILVNGYVTTDTGSLTPNIEEINKEKSSIYMTSTQKIPLQPGASIINPRVNTVKPNNYIFSQLIFNSDRITLNSKKDEILLFSKTNIELNSDNIININAGKVAHINSPSIALGTKSDGSYPTEPVLLGGKTQDLFLEIFGTLTNLASYLASSNIPELVCAGEQLFADIDNLLDMTDKIPSENVFTI